MFSKALIIGCVVAMSSFQAVAENSSEMVVHQDTPIGPVTEFKSTTGSETSRSFSPGTNKTIAPVVNVHTSDPHPNNQPSTTTGTVGVAIPLE